MQLSEIKKEKFVNIKEINKDCPIKIRRRLLDLGFTTGERLKIARKSFLKKVLLIEIRGYTLSLQSKIARYVIVEE